MVKHNGIELKTILTGVGIAALVFTGCMQLDPASSEPAASTTPTEALRLSVKNTDSCKALQADLIAAHAVGDDSAKATTFEDLHKAFMGACVEHVAPVPGHESKEHLQKPPELKQDSNTHCHWSISKMEKGETEMTVTYAKVCGEDRRHHDEKDEKDSVKTEEPKHHDTDSVEIEEPEHHDSDSVKVEEPKHHSTDSVKVEEPVHHSTDSVKVEEPKHHDLDSVKVIAPHDTTK
jgi:hypothetical protein